MTRYLTENMKIASAYAKVCEGVEENGGGKHWIVRQLYTGNSHGRFIPYEEIRDVRFDSYEEMREYVREIVVDWGMVTISEVDETGKSHRIDPDDLFRSTEPLVPEYTDEELYAFDKPTLYRLMEYLIQLTIDRDVHVDGEKAPVIPSPKDKDDALTLFGRCQDTWRRHRDEQQRQLQQQDSATR